MASYDSVAEDQLAAVINSWGVLEIAECNGNAQQTCGAKVGDQVVVACTS
jgi:S-adenosylmethionine hydrolase